MAEKFEELKQQAGEEGKNIEESIKDHSSNFGGTAGGADISKFDAKDKNYDKVYEQANAALEKNASQHKEKDK